MNQMSGECRPSFTPRQGQYLAFIDAYTRVHRRPPAEREMQRHFGVTPPSVHQMVLNLERAGLIRRQPGVPRSIEVLVPPEDLPVLQHMSSRSKPLCRGTSFRDTLRFQFPSAPSGEDLFGKACPVQILRLPELQPPRPGVGQVAACRMLLTS